MKDFTTVQSAPSNGAPQEEAGIPDRLLRAEKKIHRWEKSTLTAGRAMRRIGSERLYRERGYDTIEDYAQEQFDIGDSRWHQLVRYAETYDVLDGRLGSGRPLPQNESQSRPLQPHRGAPEVLTRIWEKVLKRHGETLSRKKIEAVVEDVTSPGLPDDDDEGPPPGDSGPRAIVIKAGDIGAWPDGSLAKGIRTLDIESEPAQPGSSDGDDDQPDGAPSSSGENESSSGSDTDEEHTDEEDGDPTRLERLQEKHAPLRGDLNDGVARGLITVAEAIADGDALGHDDLKTARENFEGLSHRGESSDDQDRLPGCITGDLDTIDDRDILIAVPTEMLTPGMARKAVPVGVPQTQSVVGVPLSHFEGRPPTSEILAAHREQSGSPEFNDGNESIDWADYTINPISGCLHTCTYCYARYQAEQMNRYKQGFHPTFFPGRLLAFSEMDPSEETGHPREKNVFVGSMSDIFGKWVPSWMIRAILDEVEENDGFDYLFLTKFPQKLSQFDFPDNAWVGTTVDKKHRVALAERHFQEVDAKVKWLSCEPLLENVAPEFEELSMFDCVVIGAQQDMGQEVKEKQPKLDWVMDLHQKAREAGCTVYYKENLDLEYPKELPVSQ